MEERRIKLSKQILINTFESVNPIFVYEDMRMTIEILKAFSENSIVQFFPEILVVLMAVYYLICVTLPDREEFVLILLMYGVFYFSSTLNYGSFVGIMFDRVDEIAVWGSMIALFSAFIGDFYDEKKENYFNFTMLIIFLNLLLYSTNLMSFFICMEACSFIVFLLASDGSKTVVKLEAVIKYFVVTAWSSTFILLAISLLYFLSGSIFFDNLVVFYAMQNNNLTYKIPLIMLITGIFLKIGVFPGYSWVADVAEGFSIASYLTVNILYKFALLAFLKLVICNFADIDALFFICGTLTAIMGVFLTLSQTKIIRILAYSSLPHIGLALCTFPLPGIEYFSLGYLTLYFISLYKFAATFSDIEINTEKLVYVTDLSYLIDEDLRHLFTFNILEMAGFPPYNLFFLKLFLIFSLVQHNQFSIAVLFLLVSLISLFYYVRLAKNLHYDLNSPFAIISESFNWVYYCGIEYAWLMFWLMPHAVRNAVDSFWADLGDIDQLVEELIYGFTLYSFLTGFIIVFGGCFILPYFFGFHILQYRLVDVYWILEYKFVMYFVEPWVTESLTPDLYKWLENYKKNTEELDIKKNYMLTVLKDKNMSVIKKFKIWTSTDSSEE